MVDNVVYVHFVVSRDDFAKCTVTIIRTVLSTFMCPKIRAIYDNFMSLRW